MSRKSTAGLSVTVDYLMNLMKNTCDHFGLIFDYVFFFIFLFQFNLFAREISDDSLAILHKVVNAIGLIGIFERDESRNIGPLYWTDNLEHEGRFSSVLCEEYT